MKTIILGHKSFVANHLPYEKVKDRLEPDYNQLNSIIEKYNPNVIVNCVGFTGSPNIDQCEKEKQKTLDANLIIPVMLANICEKKNIQFIHIGSGCINYGPSRNIKISLAGPDDAGWKELDPSAPKSFYSKTKYACDLAIGSLSNSCVLRIRMPISEQASPRNLISKLIKYSEVLEEPNSVTFLPDLVNAIKWVIDNKKSGIYNVCSPKPLTHSIILNEYKKYVPSHKFTSITVEQLEKLTVAPRSNCIIDSSKITSEGFSFIDQDEAIKQCVKNFIEQNGK
jgi:3,5-epimerase/4-reductase